MQQAFDLARRNNRQLQVAELTLERSRAALREAQAELYPTLGVQVGITNTEAGTSLSNINLPGQINTATTGQTNTATTGQTNTDTTGLANTDTTGLANTDTTGQTNTDTTGQTNTDTTGQTNTATTGQTTNTGTNQQTTNTGTNQQTTNTGTNQQTTNTGTNQQDDGGRSTALRGTVSLSYDLYTAGARRARIRAAEEQVRFDQLDVERLAEQVRLDVSNDYFNLQAADELVRINRAAVTNAQASLRDAQALEQAGVGTRFDVLRSQVQLANSTQDLTNSLSQQQIARRQLATRLSLAQSVSVTAAEPVEIAGLWNPTLEESIVLAFQNRAELEQLLAQRNQFEQRRRIALSTIRPQVSLTATYQFSDEFDDDQNFGDGYSIGPNVSLNLFDGGAARARAAQEEANIAIAETNFADTRNQIRFEVEQAFSNLQSNLENIQTASVALEQARESLRLARLRFQAGVGTQTDVINAENDLTNAEGNRVTAILDYNRAFASLQRAITSGQPR